MKTFLLLFLLFATSSGIASPGTASSEAATKAADTIEPVRLAITAFGTSAEVEVHGMPTALAEKAAQAALQEIYEVERLSTKGVEDLNAAAGGPPQEIDERLGEMILRGLQFCIWSSGSYGPLSGELRHLWQQPKRPHPEDIRWALGSGECNRILLESKTQVQILEGSILHLHGLDRGMAVDRAIVVLKEHGVRDAWIEIGNVLHGMGAGPDGNGWYVRLPPPPGSEEPLDEIWLRDQTLVFIGLGPEERRMDELIIDQRAGVPASGVVALVTVTERAVDAQPLAVALYILGRRDGQPRLGTLEPRPAVYWLLGNGEIHSLESTYHWGDLQHFESLE